MLANIDKVELVTSAPDGRWRVIAIVEEGEWQEPKALWLLQEKMNALLSYVLDGQMREQFPDSAAGPVTLVLSSVESYPDEATQLIDRLRPIIEGEGLGFEVNRTADSQAA